MMTKEQIEELKQLAEIRKLIPEGAIIGQFNAPGSVSIGNIEHVENLFPGSDDVIKQVLGKESKSALANQQPSDAYEEEVSYIDRIHRAIRAVKQAGHCVNDYDWGAVCAIIKERTELSDIGWTECESILVHSGAFTKETCPSASSMKKVSVSGKFPDWTTDKGYDTTKRFVDIARDFLYAYMNN